MFGKQPRLIWRSVPETDHGPVASAQYRGLDDDDPRPPQEAGGPILREACWRHRLPQARAHVAVVVVYKRGDHLVIWPHERKRVELHRRPATAYEVARMVGAP